MKQVNIFHKGLQLDLDVTKRSNDVWDLPTSNMRIINVDGQGFVATNIEGNEFDPNNGRGIKLPDGYIVIGCCEVDQIIYFALYNATTGEGEFGSYPSPKQWTDYNVDTWNYSTDIPTINTSLTGFERVYKPFINFKSSIASSDRKGMRSTNIEFDRASLGDMFGRVNFDKTVTLFFCDGKNINKVINNGFDKDTGEYSTDRKLLTPNSFPYYTSQIPLTNNIPNVSSINIEPGGKLKGGHIFYFIRYVNEDFGRTHFVHEIGPIAAYRGNQNDKTSIQGITGVPAQDDTENIYIDRSDKRVRFTVSNLDQEYKFFEIAYVRYYGDDLSIELTETGLIDNYYPIEELSTKEVIITGEETILPITIAEIQEEPIKELISNTHCQIENRYYGANWTSVRKHRDAYQEYANRISLQYDTEAISREGVYKNPSNIFNKVGYPRSEAYPFGMVFILTGGIETDVYPLKGDQLNYGGYDEINSVYLENGIYRFPDISQSNFWDASQNINILGLKFDNTDANTYKNNNVSEFSDVIGFYYVRGPRHKNLRYQGLTMIGCTSYLYIPTNQEAFYRFQRVENYNAVEGQSGLVDKDFKLPEKCSDKNSSNEAFYEDPGSPGSFAQWLGQSHKNETEASAASDYWGANSPTAKTSIDTEQEEEQGFKDECVHNDLATDEPITIPLWKGLLPVISLVFKDSDVKNEIRHHMSMAYYRNHRYACISPDYIFDQRSNVEDGLIIKVQGSTFESSLISGTDYDYGFDLYKDNKGGRVGGVVRDTKQVDGRHSRIYPWFTLSKFNTTTYPYLARQETISNAELIDVPKFTKVSNSKNGFVSEYTDAGFDSIGLFNTGTCMFYWTKQGTSYYAASNRSMSTCKYIGIKTSSNSAYMNRGLINIYNEDPDTLSASDLKSKFDINNINYTRISEVYTSFADTSSDIQFKGDCFLQITYIKQMAFNGSSVQEVQNKNQFDGSSFDTREAGLFVVNDNQPMIYAGHGHVIELLTENFINTEMRHESKDRTFYPLTGDVEKFAAIYPDTNDKTESLLLNAGYNHTEYVKAKKAYNERLPQKDYKFSTRIRYTDKYLENSFTDGYRSMRELDYKDYTYSEGDIIRLINYKDYLISYQEHSVNRHYASERQQRVNSDEGTFVLGDGEILSQKYNKLQSSGLQHKWGLAIGDNEVFSFDWLRRSINRLGFDVSGTQAKLGSNSSTTNKLCSKMIYDIAEVQDVQTDIVNNFIDDPYNGSGISAGYDPKYKDFIFSVIDEANESKTFVYNELIGGYIGNYNWNSPLYFNLKNDFYSAKKDSVSDANSLYIHNSANVDPCNFYGVDYDWKLSFIVNGNQSEQNSSMYSKHFHSLEIEMSQYGLKEVYYYTEQQTGYHDNWDQNDSRFWLAPEYSENKWKFPIKPQTNPTDTLPVNEFNIDSYMTGTYMKVTLIGDSNNKVFIKNIITNFELSQF